MTNFQHEPPTTSTHTAELDSPFRDNLARRQAQAGLFKILVLASTIAAIAILACLLFSIARDGLPWLNWNLITSFPSRVASRAGIISALVGSAVVISITASMSVVLGLGAAVYLEELAPKNKLSQVIDLNISNLCGVPSLVYGMLGLAVFVRVLGFGRSLLAAGCTLALMILPIIIIASRESLKSVPPAIRLAALALGATRWQTTWHHIIPAAAPGMLTGIILALSRALGEAAPLIMVGGVTYIAFLPNSLYDSFTTLPIQIFNWAGRPQDDFHGIAAAAILVLVGLVLITNGIAIVIRAKLEKKNRW